MKSVIAGESNPAAQAKKALASRLDTIAVTETARSFNESRQAIIETVRPRNGYVLVKEWDAKLDACPFCAAQDGMVVLATDSFPGGEPGSAHPRCQCLAQYREISRLEFYMLAA